MSAILGRIAFDGRTVAADSLAAAAAALAPYGPDGSGQHLAGDAALALFRMDIARGRPAESRPLTDGGVTLVADAILDDRAGLAAALGLAPGTARGLSDSALILRAWQRWAEDCPRHLIGDFAFALWDSGRRRLFLARDHIGTRPLYWARRGEEVLFATDLRGIVAFSGFDWQIDAEMVSRYLRAADRPLPRCLIAGVQAVPPGHGLTIAADGATATRWWDPAAIPLQAGIDPGEAARRLAALTAEAVACRIDTDTPVGSHLSGGIDSTAVTVLAARALRADGRALAAAYCWAPAPSPADPDMGEWDERRIVADLAAAEAFPLRYGDADAAGFLDYLRRPIELDGTADLAEELPVIDKARADGVRVMLSGWGGDEAVTAHGSGYIAWLLRRGRLRAALRAARALGASRRPGSIARLVWAEGLVPLLPGRLFDLCSPYARMYPRQSFIAPALAARFPPPGRDVRTRAAPREFAAALLVRGHLAARMETWAAWAAPAGMQYRYPLLDRRLLDFVLSLPPEVMHGPGRGRHLVRAALKGVLPRRLSKADLANERLRARVNRACWAALAATPPALPAGDPGWIDLAALGTRLAHRPQDEDAAAIAFAEVCAAMRMFHLARRHAGPELNNPAE